MGRRGGKSLTDRLKDWVLWPTDSNLIYMLGLTRCLQSPVPGSEGKRLWQTKSLEQFTKAGFCHFLVVCPLISTKTHNDKNLLMWGMGRVALCPQLTVWLSLTKAVRNLHIEWACWYTMAPSGTQENFFFSWFGMGTHRFPNGSYGGTEISFKVRVC